MKTFLFFGAVACVVCAAHSDVIAQREILPSVTLELCGDVDSEEIQEAIGVEYQGREHGVVVSVECRGEMATLRMIGPSHPQGRIIDIDLSGVVAVAISRTLAVLAVEMWTAPEALPGKNNSTSFASAQTMRSESTDKPSGWNTGYRKTLSIGAGLAAVNRRISSTGFYQSGLDVSFASWYVQGDWPIRSWLGLFTRIEHGASDVQSATEFGSTQYQLVTWRRAELGAYVPVYRDRLRLDLRASTGFDRLRLEGMNVDFNYISVGVDWAYPVLDRTLFTGSLTSYTGKSESSSSVDGQRHSVGARHFLSSKLHVEAQFVIADVGGSYVDVNGREYDDILMSVEFGVNYSL